MFNIYFGNRLISISDPKEAKLIKSKQIIYCKDKKSFDKIYNNFLSNKTLPDLAIVSINPKKIFKYLRNKYLHIKAAGGLVFNENNELLVIKRNGKWDLPKGKIEEHEKKKHAAVREVEEECGISNPIIRTKLLKTFHTYTINSKNVFKTTYWYAMKYKGHENLVPQTKEGITEVKWVPINMVERIKENSYKSLQPLYDSIIKK